MNTLRRAMGFVWIILGPLVLVYLVKTASPEIAKNPGWDTRIEWSIFILVFIPIAAGLVLFGYYAVRGEYEEAS